MRGKNKGSIIRMVFSITGIVAFAKSMGFVKQMVIASSFGASIETDLLSLSQNIVGDLDYILVQILLTSFIPIYISVKEKDKREADRFVTNALIAWMGLSFFFVIFLEIIAPTISRIIAPSYDKELQRRLSKYIRINAPTIVAMIACAFFNALLRANKRFIPGELLSVIQSVTMITLIIILKGIIGVKVILVGYFVYTIINAMYIFVLAKKEWHIQISKPFFDNNIKQMNYMSIPLLVGYSMIFFNQQVDKAIVSGLGSGVVTAVGYAAILTNLIATMIGSVSSVVFTYVSQSVAESNDCEAADLVERSSVIFTTVLAPVSVIIIFNSADIVQLVYGRGAFDEQAITNTTLALMGYGVSIVFYAYRELFSRLQYSYKESRLPMINSTIGIVFNILLSIVLSKYIGVLGVTLASSVSVIICSMLNVKSSKKSNSFVKLSLVFKYIPYWSTGCLLCVVLSRKCNTWFNHSALPVKLFFSTTIPLLTYGLICVLIVNIKKSILNLNNESR